MLLKSVVIVFCACFVARVNAQISLLTALELLLQPQCRPSHYKEDDAPTCADAAAQTVSVSPDIYGPPGMHYNVMGSSYYMARMALGLNARCATNRTEWGDMQLTTPWNGLDRGVALDWGFFTRVIKRLCTFPAADGSYPFLCQGAAGTPFTNGASLGWLSYIPVLTDNVNWCLFVHCWDPDRPGHSGSNYARSWNVFSKQKTLSPSDKASILSKVQDLGFDVNQAYSTSFVNPSLNQICPA